MMKSAPKPHNEAERLRSLYELDILDTLEEQAYDDLTYSRDSSRLERR